MNTEYFELVSEQLNQVIINNDNTILRITFSGTINVKQYGPAYAIFKVPDYIHKRVLKRMGTYVSIYLSPLVSAIESNLYFGNVMTFFNSTEISVKQSRFEIGTYRIAFTACIPLYKR